MLQANKATSPSGWYAFGCPVCGSRYGQMRSDASEEGCGAGILKNSSGKEQDQAVRELDLQVVGEIFLNLGGSHVDEAEQWVRKSIEVDARTG